MKIPAAKLSICRRQGSLGDRIVIEIKDDASRLTMVEVEVTPEQFGLAVTGRSEVPCEGTYNDSGRIGKRREVKRELVFVPDSAMDGSESVRACVPFEVDGWLADYEDARNQNNVDRAGGPSRAGVVGGFYRVRFVRYVEAS